MSNTKVKTRYSPEELEEFRQVILNKLRVTKEEMQVAQESLLKTNEQISKDKIKTMEDSSVVEEQENLNYLLIRLQKFTANLEAALLRIKNGTYGICVKTKKLIDKQRLLLVPHTTHSLEAKNERNAEEE